MTVNKSSDFLRNLGHLHNAYVPGLQTKLLTKVMSQYYYNSIDVTSLLRMSWHITFMIIHNLGVKSFNLDSKRGLKELERFGFLDATNPEEIAYFLFHEGR